MVGVPYPLKLSAHFFGPMKENTFGMQAMHEVTWENHCFLFICMDPHGPMKCLYRKQISWIAKWIVWSGYPIRALKSCNVCEPHTFQQNLTLLLITPFNSCKISESSEFYNTELVVNHLLTNLWDQVTILYHVHSIYL